MVRRIAVALAALNESAHIAACVSALIAQSENIQTAIAPSIHVLVNNSVDDTAHILKTQFSSFPALYVHEVTLLPQFACAGWARRLAMEEASRDLRADHDLLLSTDADTIVAKDWLKRTLAHFDRGFDAIAGFAFVRSAEWLELNFEQRRRLSMLRKYRALASYLRIGASGGFDAWPRHEYEGGASMAVTFRMYREIGGCPPLPIGEDKAMFEAVRCAGGKIRHALDVRVATSGRLIGRAPGGMADTIQAWCNQSLTEPLHDVWPITVELGHVPPSKSALLTFEELPAEIRMAQALVRKFRSAGTLALSA